jgi:peroxiredoxin
MRKFVLSLCASLTCSMAMAITPFNLPWMNATSGTGVNYSSAERPNAVFVVEAYFLNCPYCNENAQNVNDLAAKYSAESRVQVLDVGIDRKDSQYATWISRHNPNHPVLKDASRELIGQLGTTGYPSTYVIDCHGEVTYKHVGEWEAADIGEISAHIDEALKTECNSGK